MALKKSQLYRSLWSSCDALRGGMDASQYKDYILTFLFVKYVTDKYAGKPGALIEVPEGGSFDDVVAAKNTKDIGNTINEIIKRLAEANPTLKGVIDVTDFNDPAKLGSGQEMQDRLTSLVGIFQDLPDMSGNRAEGDDLLGDAYEYLMRHFATESGKSKGQFYTPAEVSRIMAGIVGIGASTRQDQSIYDPTCGSGSLLLKAANEAPQGITIYGQEMDVATWALANMNMILHGHETAQLWRGNTLAAPYTWGQGTNLKTFDFVVANPPFSVKAWTTGFNPENDLYGRFEYGVPPAKNGDYAFLLHMIKSLKSTGKVAVVLPHGVLFRGNKEGDIRRNLIKQKLIKGIIGLPANLFFGTGIPACLVVIDKENTSTRAGIFMIDARRGYVKDGNKNRLREQDIHRIVDVFNNQIQLAGYSRLVPFEEIASPANSYNLNIPRYVDSSEPEDIQDLDAHLRGGIPNRDIDALSAYWQVFASLRAELFEDGDGDRPGYSRARIEPVKVKATVLAHPEFVAYRKLVEQIVADWSEGHRPLLEGLEPGVRSREVIETLSEDLLARFRDDPLLDAYDVYQCLTDYWGDVMQDDVHLIAVEGWMEAAKPRLVIDDKKRNIKESPDLTIGSGKNATKLKMDLIPPVLIVSRFLRVERIDLEGLQSDEESAKAALDEYIEENAADEGLLEDVRDEKGGVTKKAITARLKVIEGVAETDDERDALVHCRNLIDAHAAAKKSAKAKADALDKASVTRYAELTQADLKTLVVQDKWFADLATAVHSEMDRISQRLTQRVSELAERYETPLPQIVSRVSELEAKAEAHLARMGASWS